MARKKSKLPKWAIKQAGGILGNLLRAMVPCRVRLSSTINLNYWMLYSTLASGPLGTGRHYSTSRCVAIVSS